MISNRNPPSATVSGLQHSPTFHRTLATKAERFAAKKAIVLSLSGATATMLIGIFFLMILH
jgi:hypothetical protein